MDSSDLQNVMDWLLELDRKILLGINANNSSFGDIFMWTISDKLVWLPVYLLLLIWMYRKFGWQISLLALLMIGLSVGIADSFCSAFLKPFFERLRPCHEIDLRPILHLVNNKCGGKYGFASSHSANFFAMATFLAWIFKYKIGKWRYAFFGIAALVAFSRVYLGVHYPSDILAGMLIGIAASAIGIFVFKILARKLNFPQDFRQ